MKPKIFLLLLILLFAVLPADAQCAMCRAVLQNEEGGHAARGKKDKIKSKISTK
jgi:hypothetical protein